MARDESDREDLFAEGTALRQRIELTAPNSTEPVVAGCRAHGGWSIYFGADPCYHFDAAGGLRRAFAGGNLYRTQGHTLAQLHRVRTTDVVELQRTDLDGVACAAFLDGMRLRLQSLQRVLEAGEFTCRRRFPTDVDVAALLSAGIARVLAAEQPLAPSMPTRRT